MTVSAGDFLRDPRGWEGRVLAVDGDEVTLVFGDQSVAVVPASALARNAWDPAGDGSPPSVGTRTEVLDYLSEIVEVPVEQVAVLLDQPPVDLAPDVPVDGALPPTPDSALNLPEDPMPAPADTAPAPDEDDAGTSD